MDGRERKLKIHRATVTDSCSADPANLVIPTKSGALRLEEVQLEGKRRMSVAEFLRGYQGPVRVE
jgi:methionyl-tRNA formyltransferase